MRTLVIGDIHGAHKALVQCLQNSNFDYNNDRLIVLGDVCDGWPEVKEAVDELLKIKHLDYILGNHDQWALEWATFNIKEDIWLSQGGVQTISSYGNCLMPKAHQLLLEKAPLWLKVGDSIFVHGGFDPSFPIEIQSQEKLLWDRNLLYAASRRHLTDPQYRFGNFKEIFVGHTTTQIFHKIVPLQFCNVWALDTGAGWSGKLTIMEVDSKKYWQSDLTPSLYPQIHGREHHL